MTKTVKRRIVRTDQHLNPGWEKSRFVGGSSVFTLECGHTTSKKLSAGIPKDLRTICRECTNLRDSGGSSTRFDMAKLLATVETWDHETGELSRTVRPMTPQEVKHYGLAK